MVTIVRFSNYDGYISHKIWRCRSEHWVRYPHAGAWTCAVDNYAKNFQTWLFIDKWKIRNKKLSFLLKLQVNSTFVKKILLILMSWHPFTTDWMLRLLQRIWLILNYMPGVVIQLIKYQACHGMLERSSHSVTMHYDFVFVLQWRNTGGVDKITLPYILHLKRSFAFK